MRGPLDRALTAGREKARHLFINCSAPFLKIMGRFLEKGAELFSPLSEAFRLLSSSFYKSLLSVKNELYVDNILLIDFNIKLFTLELPSQWHR